MLGWFVSECDSCGKVTEVNEDDLCRQCLSRDLEICENCGEEGKLNLEDLCTRCADMINNGVDDELDFIDDILEEDDDE